jgi:CRP/FNR family transcriptional regulator, cyclic AMP receptor protein
MADPSDPKEHGALPESLQRLAQRGVVKQFPRGEVLIREGELGDTIFIVLSGSIKAFSVNDSHRELVFGTYGAGDYVGEMSLDGGPRCASIVALEPTTCAVITRRTLREHIGADPDFAFELIDRLIGRLRVATENARGLALLDTYGRLVKQLNARSAETADGMRAIVPRPTHIELASLIGCSREMVTRLLKDLEVGGYLGHADGKLLLLRQLPTHW